MKTHSSMGVDQDRIVLGVSVAIVSMALVVLVGWHAHILVAVQVFPGLVPMRYNTALCFLALGAAGIGLSTRRRRLQLGGGSVAALMGALVVLEYVTGRAFGIDTLFFYPWDRAVSANPGRMALTTAISFFLTGVALLMLAIRQRAYAPFGILIMLPLSLALTSLVGDAFQITYVLPFHLGSQMALSSAAALLVYEIALLGYAWTYAKRGADGLPTWAAGFGVALLPVLLMGAGAVFPKQTWAVVSLEAIGSCVAVGLAAVAMRTLTTARVAYKGLLIIAIPLMLLLVFVGLVVHVKRQSEEAQARALHSTEVLGVAQSLTAHIAEAESAARGFVLTGEDTMAASYEASLAFVTQTTNHLRRLVRDNPLQSGNATTIEQRTTERTKHLSELVRLVKIGHPEQAEDQISAGTGADLMTQVGAAMRVFSQAEEGLSADRRRLLNASWQRLSWLLVAGTAAALLMASMLTLSFSAGIGGRLQRLRNNAVSLAAGQTLAPRLTGRDEIADVDRVFHEMAESLDAVTKRDQATRILEGQIVDRRHAEALRQTEALQRAIFNSPNFSCIATDARGVIQIFNVGAERMLGYPASEAVNELTPADLHDGAEVIARATALSLEFGTPIAPGFEALVFKASRGIEDTYELTKVRKDGSRFPAVVSVTALRDGQNAIIGYLLLATDNTAQKQVDEERQKFEQRLRDQHFYTRSLIESSIDALMTTDPLGIVTDVNRQMETLTGCTRDELIGAPFKNSFTNPERAEAAIRRVLIEQRVTNYELTARARDGRETVVSCNATTFHDRDRRLQGVFAAARDVTDRKQVEDALRKSEARLRAFVAASSDVVYQMSPDWSEMRQLHGRNFIADTENPSGNWFQEYIHPDDQLHMRSVIDEAIRERGTFELEHRVRRVDGTFGWMFSRAIPLRDAQGDIVEWFGAASDVTERKRFEHTLQEKNVELKNASRMKSEFLATMSHELRTPLNAIIGFSEVLRDGLIGEMTEQQRAFIANIFGSGNHLLALINDILDLSKVEAGKMTLDLEPVRVSALFENSLSVIKERAAARHIRLEMDDVEALGSIQADARKCKQIVYNLLSNAVKFSNDGGLVTLRAARVQRVDVARRPRARTGRWFPLPENEFEEFLEVAVTDSGIGISPEDLEHLFRPFGQIDSSLARKFEGSGLGLILVKLLVELHGGTMAVNSAVGEGSCFTVWLPYRVPEEGPLRAAGAPAAHRVRVAAGARMALVVEDDIRAADLIRVQLEAEGFTVLHAASGEAALELAPQQPLSLITLDMILPNMDGWEFLSRLKQVPDLRRIPVVIISIVADRNRGFALGAAGVMQKPISRQELYESLVDLDLFPLSQGQTLTVLVVDDDPRAVELIAVRLVGVASLVLRAHGGREAIEVARRELPDVIVLDLMMPEVNGFDVVEALHEQPDTARIPILVVTAKQITAEDRAKLSGYVSAIMEKTEFDRDGFLAEVRRATTSGRPLVAAREP